MQQTLSRSYWCGCPCCSTFGVRVCIHVCAFMCVHSCVFMCVHSCVCIHACACIYTITLLCAHTWLSVVMALLIVYCVPPLPRVDKPANQQYTMHKLPKLQHAVTGCREGVIYMRTVVTHHTFNSVMAVLRIQLEIYIYIYIQCTLCFCGVCISESQVLQ